MKKASISFTCSTISANTLNLEKIKKAAKIITIFITYIFLMILLSAGIGRAIDIEYADYGEKTLVSQDK